MTDNIKLPKHSKHDFGYEFDSGIAPNVEAYAEAYAREAVRLNAQADIRTLIADDAYAMTFQSLGQYRSALLAALSAAPQVVPCDCTTEIHADGTRKTWCGSDQMRRATEEGHAFAAAPQPAQPAQQDDDESDALTVAYLHGHGKGKNSVQPLLAEKDALLRQALDALELPCDRWNAVQYKIVSAAINAIRNHLGVES